MLKKRATRFVTVIMALSLSLTLWVQVQAQTPATAQPAIHASPAQPSPRLIVELTSPPLAAVYRNEVTAASVNGKLDANVPAAQAYVSQLQAEQVAFVSAMKSVLTDASVATFVNELGVTEEATYQVVFNGLSINPGSVAMDEARMRLAKLPGVKNVYPDLPHETQLYTSTALINAPVLWGMLGGRANAGAGIKIASIDGGVHHLAPMMNGAGYSYPPSYGPNGLGLTANNNGKIIVSRAYFRTWDPPATGDENPWPGVAGTSHGMHTSSTAAGDVVTATYQGFDVGEMSGVAPKAYVMSYRVFYASVNGIGSFYTTEGIAAIEDMVKDGADVVNNSWGGGPTSIGGQFDPLDLALINATKAGVFVSMSNGNAGPNPGTGDHPSAAYINVAASTTSGTLAKGRLLVPSAAPNLQAVPFGSANFGKSIPSNSVLEYPYLPASVVNPANVEGCNAWPADTFANKAALISRGSCDFSLKVFNAQQAGALFVVIYNHATGGDDIMNMGAGDNANQVTIASSFIGKSNGDAMVNHYAANGAAAANLRVDTKNTFQAGNIPDRIIGFSSRGPGVGGTLKPDIAAPGVNILAQGYTDGVSGEARHLGYGQVSGTSMASPHVAGAAALLRQQHPDWPVAWVKSALMSTAQYMNIFLNDGKTPAQPLDMGAGRLDLAKAADPGVILDPPSLSFGFVITGAAKTMTITVLSVADTTETYNLSTLYTGDSFTTTTSLAGFSVAPTSLTLSPGQSKQVQVTFDPATGNGIGDNQGYIVMDGSAHNAHLPAWARVMPAAKVADVLLIDGDFSTLGANFGFPLDDYRWYYTHTLDDRGYSYSVVDYNPLLVTNLPDAATLSGYAAILYFTGDNYVGGAGLSAADMDKLVEYLNAGGVVLAMGQDLSAALDMDETDPANAPVFYQYGLGANWIQDSVTGNGTPYTFITPAPTAPTVFQNVALDLRSPLKYDAGGALAGAQEAPAPVTTGTTGSFVVRYDQEQNQLKFRVTVVPTDTTPITVTNAHIHFGAEGVAGPPIRNLLAIAEITTTTYVTGSMSFSGIITPSLNFTETNQLLNNELYINVHTTANPGGEIRGQIKPKALKNQAYMDELDNRAHDGSNDPTGGEVAFPGIPLFQYAGLSNKVAGTVAMVHRDQPSLEQAEITYRGRSIYTAFGLEGLSEALGAAATDATPVSRSQFLGKILEWLWAEPATTVQITSTVAVSSTLFNFDATAAYGLQRHSTAAAPASVQYRWDFGDGSAYVISSGSQSSHQYRCSDTDAYTVRVEVTDNYGNVTVGEQQVTVGDNCSDAPGLDQNLYLPLVAK
ncbi:MAG: S8 family serine peptidase [Caldilineaceae bacterium]